MKAGKKARRGQAMLELALGSLVFVTVLVFGIHFAEWGYISMKVTEASSSALWDSTAYKLHQWPNDDGPASQAATKAGLDAHGRYQDFDGRTSSVGSSLSQVFTHAEGMQVSCRSGVGIGFAPHLFTNLAYSNNGGISCQAEAQITVTGFPSSFADQNAEGFFKAKNYVPPPIRVCAVGRPAGIGGSCGNGFHMALDDWGMSSRRESGVCAIVPNAPLLGCVLNVPYFAMAGSVYLLNGLGQGVAGTAMVTRVTRSAPPFPSIWPGGENMFWMSHIGEIPLFSQPLQSESGVAWWGTTPGGPNSGWGGVPYVASYVIRAANGGCFLGKPC